MDHRRHHRRDSYDSDDTETNNNNESDLTRQIDKLNRDLKRRDRELDDERQENLRILERIKKLERDKVELRREAEDFRDEANEYKKALEDVKQKRKPNEDETKQNFELAVQQKNHEITQLLDDIEKLEGEKGSLQTKLHELKDSLQEATAQLEGMTQEHMGMKTRLQKSEVKIKELQDDKVILEIKVKDLLSFKQRHDQYLENLSNAVDVRVDVWKKMMFQKDEEINRLNVKLATLANQMPTGQAADTEKTIINQLKLKLVERESTISTLNEKLAQATQDLESATEHINNLNSKLKFMDNPEKTGSVIESLQSKVAKFKSQLEKKDSQISLLEKEAEERSAELTSLLSRMHGYELGVYGLSEAINEIKELKTQLRIRNTQIETQTQELNSVSLKVNDLFDENEMLREKSKMGSKTDLKEETHKFISGRQAELATLKSKNAILEEEIVQLKSRNYTYRKQLNQVDEFGKSGKMAAKFDGNQEEWKDKYDIVLGENAELRKGLQDILETMQRMTDEGTSDVLIECPILENLLREMSARGLIHYPYGISSFHLKVCNLEGKNSQLREEIHRLKHEEKLNRTELINANATIQSLKDKVASVVCTDQASNSSDSLVLNLQSEIESLHAQIKHLQDVLQMDSTVDSMDQSVQTQDANIFHEATQTENTDQEKLQWFQNEVDSLRLDIQSLNGRLEEQAILLDAKDKVINDFKFVNISYQGDDSNKSGYPTIGQLAELEEALNIARETTISLQERLKAKEDNINQYRNLLAEVRNELTSATNRHVQEMRALQLTIYQQQQAFTRMKSTLSQPVKDTLNIEGTIKDQLTRIHELEDEVSELQHALGNVASQLTTARSEAHRWRCTAEARLKEMDQARETHTNESIEEISLLRDKLKQQQQVISELQSEVLRLKSTKDSINDIVNVIRNEQHATTGQQKSAAAKELQERLTSKENEISQLQLNNKNLQTKISQLQVKISKISAVNKHTGVSAELENLRNKFLTAEDEKSRLEQELRNLNRIRDDEDDKKKKAVESMARWEEAKKWKKQVEKMESQIDLLKKENEKLTVINKNLRANITRLDKMVLDCKKLQLPPKRQPDDPVEVDKLKFEIQDLNELVEKTEFEGREKIATLDMEIRCLKDRIVSQERQLAAYQVAQKGDPRVVTEIEKMANKEEELQKIIGTLEEENLHLKLQIDQLRLDTPRLRDRVQQLQRLVEILKQEKPDTNSNRVNSQKSLSELERTISALKQLIEKLQTENKRLRVRPSSKSLTSTSSENLRATLESLMLDKKNLMDQLALLEEEKKKYQKMYIEASSSLEAVQIRLLDAERRAKSSEMKLRTFLGGEDSEEHSVYHKIKSLQDALDRKTKLLDDAKIALQQAACSK